MCRMGRARNGSAYCPMCFDLFADRHVKEHYVGKPSEPAQETISEEARKKAEEEEARRHAEMLASLEIPYCQPPVADEPSSGPVISEFEREERGLPPGALYGYDAGEARAYWAAMNGETNDVITKPRKPVPPLEVAEEDDDGE